MLRGRFAGWAGFRRVRPGAHAGAAAAGVPAVANRGGLRILDVTTGDSAELPSIVAPWAAAYSPDGTRLAVQTGHDVWVTQADGNAADVIAVRHVDEVRAVDRSSIRP